MTNILTQAQRHTSTPVLPQVRIRAIPDDATFALARFEFIHKRVYRDCYQAFRRGSVWVFPNPEG
jgi:hypothetical protein